MSLHNRAECGCWVGPWHGIGSPPRCPRHSDHLRFGNVAPDPEPAISESDLAHAFRRLREAEAERTDAQRRLAEAEQLKDQAAAERTDAQRRLAEAEQLKDQAATLASLSFESAATLAIAKLSDRAANALANDEMAEHDLLQEAIELLHEAMRTAERARASRSGGG